MLGKPMTPKVQRRERSTTFFSFFPIMLDIFETVFEQSMIYWNMLV